MKVAEFQDYITTIVREHGLTVDFVQVSKRMVKVIIRNLKSRREHGFMLDTNAIESPMMTAINIWADYKVAEEAPTYANNRFASNPSLTTEIKNVIFHDPATIVYWEDGSRTVVKVSENDMFDPEKGLAMAIVKRALGDQGNYYNVFRKWLPEEEPKLMSVDAGYMPKCIVDALNDMMEEAKRATKAMSAIDWEDFWYDR